MSTSEKQAANVAAGLAYDAKMPEPLTIDEWRRRIALWAPRFRMGMEVIVGELHQLVERCARAEERVAACERFAHRHPQGDALRRVLYPSQQPPAPDDTCVYCERPVQPYAECLCLTS